MFDISASLRLGGEEVTYDDHVLIVGDAAGMIDPLTGELLLLKWVGAKRYKDINSSVFKFFSFNSGVMLALITYALERFLPFYIILFSYTKGWVHGGQH